jgi:hypothetical protein
MARLRVARDLAANTRAVVGLDGASELSSAVTFAADVDADAAPAADRPAPARNARKPRQT